MPVCAKCERVRTKCTRVCAECVRVWAKCVRMCAFNMVADQAYSWVTIGIFNPACYTSFRR